jgi:cell division protein FtsX
VYLLKLALRPWRLAPLSQLLSAAAVGFLLLLCGFLVWLERGLGPVVHRLGAEQVITAYLDPALDLRKEMDVKDSIQVAVGAQAVSVRLVSSDTFLKEIEGQFPELSKELSELGPDVDTVVPRYVSVAGVLPAQALERVKVVPGVESVESSRDRYRHVVGAFRALRWVARALVAGLLLALLTGLAHLARTHWHLHRDAISLLALWGAGPARVRAPGLLSGFSVGVAGGAVAFAGWSLAGGWLIAHVRALSPILLDLPAPGPGMAGALLLCGAAAGLLAGAVSGTRVSVRGESHAG